MTPAQLPTTFRISFSSTHQINAGEKITEKDVALIHTFKPFIPNHPMVRTIQELIGKTAEVGIPTGDPITTDEIRPQTK
jgi:hypothetical protein